MEPGYTNDLCSAFYPLGAASPVFSSFELHEHGLRWLRAPLVLAHPASDDTCAVLSTDLDETADSLDGFSAGDGDAWRRLYQRWERLEPSLLDSLFTPFPPMRGGIELLRQTGIGQLAELARFMLLPARQLGVEEFGGAGARRLLAGAALHADLPPEAALSGFFGWLMCGLGQHVGFGRPETPIKGLFLASASAHPGGGVHGGPGANAARAALWAFRRQRIRPMCWIR